MTKTAPSNEFCGLTLRQHIDGLRHQVARLDASVIASADAVALFELFCWAESSCAAGKALMAARVRSTNAWKSSGSSSAEEFISSSTGCSTKQARDLVATGNAMEAHTSLSDAFRSGRVNSDRAAALVPLVSAPGSVEAASEKTVRQLKEEARRLQASEIADDAKLARAQHGARSARYWVDQISGMFHLHLTASPEVGASVQTAVDRLTDKYFRQFGTAETAVAYRADAVAELLTTGASNCGSSVPKANVTVIVDRSALQRGYTKNNERSEIIGVGPTPVSTVKSLLSDAFLRVLFTKATEVVSVGTVGRTIPTAVRTTLIARSPTCDVPGCSMDKGLQIDHRHPLCEGGPSRIGNLARLCVRHHAMKTRDGWCLVGPFGAWEWVKRRTIGDGGSGYPLDHEEDPASYAGHDPPSLFDCA